MRRSALAYLVRSRTEAATADLAEVLGVSREDTAPSLTRRLALADRARRRGERLGRLEDQLRQVPTDDEKTTNLICPRGVCVSDHEGDTFDAPGTAVTETASRTIP